ncbi:hypothetical protein HUE87_09045 [Candidatus Sulfurimonas marisnigri]|uniref:Uncharacterized protein n=1 Tax=Candidatus Sulfurimonas marisnigri TaxID=2740405 RepID=A0A7S7RQ29_9BACT|nr:hypothetical protein [Candidatus Sulfurimonas marisnigri]QOY54030.1 hypothetical protein HUE87_09045 [Candidatus Sulfurimonas marisnigri]
MADLAKRGSPKYTDIEGFKPYELTHCIVYEMASRNKKVLDILEKLSYIEEFKKTKPYSNLAYTFVLVTDEEEKKFLAMSKYSLSELRHELEETIDWDIICKNLIKTSESKGDNTDGDNGIDFIYKEKGYCQDVSEDKRKLVAGYLEIAIAELEDDLVNNYFIYPEGYVSNFQGADEDYIHEVETRELTDIGTTFDNEVNKSVHKGFYVLQEMHKHNKTYAINHILPNFKRKIHNSNQVATFLNFSLPLNEILEYISHIKNTLNDQGNIDERIIKSPAELLGEKLDKADDINNMCSENRNSNLKCFEGRKGLTKTEKFADMFFIYDMIKAGKIKSEILIALDKYHDKDNIKTKSFHGDTYDKYLLIAKDYINNERYKELITGVKKSENI